MSANKKITQIEQRFCQMNDRWIYIERNGDNKIIGLNFMQGDELELFQKSYCVADQGLTDYWESMLYTFSIEKDSCSELSFINKCMWSYFTAISSSENYSETSEEEDMGDTCRNGKDWDRCRCC